MPELRKQARDDLIEEQLKLQEAKRLNITIEDRDIDQIMRGLAERNKMNDQQFAAHLKSMGAEVSAMRERFRATLAWNEVVRRTFGNEVSVNERDVEKFVSQGAKGEDQIELKLVRLLLPLPAKADQRSLAERYDAAERTRQTKPGCKGLIGEANRLSAKFEDLGARTPGQYGDPIRTWLLNAEENEVLPPNVTPAGIELMAVCKRVVVKADEQKRNAAISDLRQSAFEVRARGLLQDLRGRAEIVDSNRQALR
jgi:peptidyl-prolyl cis-trans isomerase SurA